MLLKFLIPDSLTAIRTFSHLLRDFLFRDSARKMDGQEIEENVLSSINILKSYEQILYASEVVQGETEHNQTNNYEQEGLANGGIVS